MQNTKNCSIIKNDSRLTLAKDWIKNLNISQFIDLNSLRTASEDASFRRYFRINDSREYKSLILMDSPPNSEPIEKFIYVADIFTRAKLSVPKIFEKNQDDGFLILEDFGLKTYLDCYVNKPNNTSQLLETACNSIIQLQLWGLHNYDPCSKLSAFSEEMFMEELKLFEYWYLKKHLKFSLSKVEQENLRIIFKVLSTKISIEPRVIIHRDFHSRNLMVLEKENTVGILDFQDAVFGPVSYDLASLVRDAYFNWNKENELNWAKLFWNNAKKQKIPLPQNFSDFLIDFDWNSIQRHLKILGIFCRLAHRDNKKKYLKDLSRVRLKCIEVASKYKEFTNLINLFEKIEKLSDTNQKYF